jgi:hypothetical protein
VTNNLEESPKAWIIYVAEIVVFIVWEYNGIYIYLRQVYNWEDIEASSKNGRSRICPIETAKNEVENGQPCFHQSRQ